MMRSLTREKYVGILALLFILLSELVHGAGSHMVFYGNSFTMRHEIPTLVKALLEEGRADDSLSTEIFGVGGKSLMHHWECYRAYNRLNTGRLEADPWHAEIQLLKGLQSSTEAPAFYNDYFADLKSNQFFNSLYPRMSGNWTGERDAIRQAIAGHEKWSTMSPGEAPIRWVVLQSWQDEADSLEAGYFKYGKKFAEVAISIRAKPILYLTAPLQQNAKPVTEAQRKKEATLILRTAFRAAPTMGAMVVPVPLALLLAQEDPSPVARTLTFRYNKDFHPNNTMAYLTACTFYAVLTGKSPEGLTFNTVSENKLQTIHGEAVTAANRAEAISSAVDPDGGNPVTVFDDPTRLFLQRMAWQAHSRFVKGEF